MVMIYVELFNKYTCKTKPLVLVHIITNKSHNVTNFYFINGNDISMYNQTYDCNREITVK